MMQSPYQLRQTFLRYAHEGFMTCIPYLYGDRELKAYHFQTGLCFSRLPRNVQDLWVYTGMRARMSSEDLETGRAALERSEQNLDSNPEDYEPYGKPRQATNN
jgi:hypothetical protein